VARPVATGDLVKTQQGSVQAVFGAPSFHGRTDPWLRIERTVWNGTEEDPV